MIEYFRLYVIVLMIAVPSLAEGTASAQQEEKDVVGQIDAANQDIDRLYSEGAYAEAVMLAEEMLQTAEAALGPNHPSTLGSVNSLGFLYLHQGRYREAEPLLQRALEATERVHGPDHPSTLASLSNLGFLYLGQGRYLAAEPLYEQALAAMERVHGPDHPHTLISVGNLGAVYEAQGRYGEAEPLYERALEAEDRTLGPDHPSTLASLNNLGYLYESQGRYWEAEPLYERALEAMERILGPDHPSTLGSLNNLGTLYLSQGRYLAAEPLYERALEAAERVLGPDHPSTLILVNNMGMLYSNQGRYLAAEPLLQRALEASERVLGPGHPSTVISANSLGALYYSQGRYGEARRHFQRAFEASERELGASNPDLSMSYGNYGYLIARHFDQPELGIFYLKKSVNVLQSIRGYMEALEDATQSAFLSKEIGAYEALQQLLIEQGRFAEADIVSRMIKEQEYYEYIRRRTGENSDPRGASILLTATEAEWEHQMITWRERPTQLAAAYKTLFDERSARDDEGAPWTDADQARLQAAQAAMTEARGKYFAKLDELQENIARLAAAEEGQVSREIAALNQQASYRFREDIAAYTGLNIAMVSLIALEDATHLLFITGSTFLHEEVPIGRAALFDQIKAARDTPGIGQPVKGGPDIALINAKLHDLYTSLIAPLEPHLEDAQTELLLINAQGAIRYVPFAALHDGEGYLAERLMTVLYNPAAGADFSVKAPSYRQASAFGVTAQHRDFDALPHVRREAEALVPGDDESGLLEGGLYLDPNFTKASFERYLGRGEIVHVATHYRMRPGDENDSNLLLGDGDLLSLAEIRANPAYDNFADTDLLVLSACETALTDEGVGAEVEGLGNILQNKGVNSVIATLWSVADETTADFMGTFYTLLIEDGLPKAQALTEAQKAMIASAEHSAPFYWAPYILQGNWE